RAGVGLAPIRLLWSIRRGSLTPRFWRPIMPVSRKPETLSGGAVLQLAERPAAADLARLADVADRARDYARAARAASTLRAYRSDWRAFATWCEARRLPALP